MAFAWSRGAGNIVTIIPSTTADVMAPPIPWMKRAATSIPWLCAAPQKTEATVKRARPAMKTLLRPIRSPKRPESSSSPPKLIR